MERRERFSSRLGFVLISAGCAIGLGNVWRFPYITGEYGGGAFVLLYLIFLAIVGLPIVVMEFAVGRASQKSVAKSFERLEPTGSKWHIYKYFALAGNVLLMMFYTTVGGWMLAYFVKMAKGDFAALNSPKQINGVFSALTSNRNEMIIYMVIISVIALIVCSMGLQNGVEKITKVMMVSLLVLIGILIVRALMLPGAMEGLKFFLKPDFTKMNGDNFWPVVSAAMEQALFTLSCGIGALAIFGSYIGKETRLTEQAVSVTLLDTMVAIMAGLMIFPACYAFGLEEQIQSGPGLVFQVLPNMFQQMPGGRIWGSLFFVFMTFAALSTIIAVFQNIIACTEELWGWNLKKASVIVGVSLIILGLPCIFGLTDWSSVTIGGMNIMDMEDFIVSRNILPLGAIVYILFCTSRYGWGWKRFIAETNAGEGIEFPSGKPFRIYCSYILPLIIFVILLQGYLAL